MDAYFVVLFGEAFSVNKALAEFLHNRINGKQFTVKMPKVLNNEGETLHFFIPDAE